MTTPPKKSLFRRFLVRLLYIVGVASILVLAGEVTARFRGFKPWVEVSQKIEIEPAGPFYTPDSLLGYRGRPGRFKLQLQDSLDFTVTHDAQGWRQTPSGSDSLPEIWIFGCSFTHGFGVDDDATYVAQLQNKLPTHRVRNFGMDAYGTLQNWLTLRQLLSGGGKPAVVVLAYGAFHDQRNTANRYWRKALHGQQIAEGISYPYIRLDKRDSLHIRYEHLEYHPLPLQRRLAFLSLIEENWNHNEDAGLRSRHVTEVLIRRIAEATQHVDARFVLAGIYRHPETESMLRTFQMSNSSTVDISVDLNDPQMRILPGNGHPNARAHAHMAASLHQYLIHKVLP